MGLKLELISCLVLLKADMFVREMLLGSEDDDDVQLRGWWTVDWFSWDEGNKENGGTRGQIAGFP